MASRSARPPKGRKAAEEIFDEGSGVAAFLMRHRMAVGGLTAFAVAFSYVAANAMWYQPHAHGSAFFATRPLVATPEGDVAGGPREAGEGETVIRLEREEQPSPAALPTPQPQPEEKPAIETLIAAPVPNPAEVPMPALSPRGDPVVEDVQRILAELKLYDGEIDGLTGPQTRNAIEGYRKMVGLSVSAEIDDQLLTQLGAAPRAVSGAPPLPEGSPGTDLIETSSAGVGDATVKRIQAGLKAFGNEGIEVDGVVGSRTRSAILEFQSLFGLPETGEPDQALYTKMREIGLAD
jgi:peptidoglycan hydrolase-like protein with peptidoglycan-binding domain